MKVSGRVIYFAGVAAVAVPTAVFLLRLEQVRIMTGAQPVLVRKATPARWLPPQNKGVKPSADQILSRLPLAFEPNLGQVDGPGAHQVKFLARSPYYALYLTSSGAALAIQPSIQAGSHESQPQSRIPAVLRMELVGASPRAVATGIGQLPGKANYFIGNNPQSWHTNVPTYSQVRYRDVYPGVDVVYYGREGQLEYDFILAPGANPQAIEFAVRAEDFGQTASGTRPKPRGEQLLIADRPALATTPLHVAANGDLVVRLADGEFRLRKPRVYQPSESGRRPAVTPWLSGTMNQAPRAANLLEGKYVLKGNNHVAFQIARYDPTRPLVIDPVVVYTRAQDQTDQASTPSIAYSTYLGGAQVDQGQGVAVDASGAVYITGFTNSTAFPLAGTPYQNKLKGGQDAFVAKLSPDGSSLIYSTYVGGSSQDQGIAIAVDASGNAYFVGGTNSSDFPVVNAFQSQCNATCSFGSTDAFVAELNPSGSALLYSTFLGGASNDQALGVALDSSNRVYVVGLTQSPGFPTKNPLPPPNNALQGGQDGFVAKLDTTQSGSASLLYSTFLGGGSTEVALGIGVDSANNIYVAGGTGSNNFPIVNAYQSAFGGVRDAFLIKLDPTGQKILYSTYLGGSNDEVASSLAVDSSQNAYLTGFTDSTDFPLLNSLPPPNNTLQGTQDAFVAKIDTTKSGSSSLVYSTYLGGEGSDTANGIGLDPTGSVTVAGQTGSTKFPLANATQATIGGNQDAFVSRLVPSGCALAFSTYLGGKTSDTGAAVAVDQAGNAYVVGYTSSNDFPTVNPLQPQTGGNTDAFITKYLKASTPAACLNPVSLTFGNQIDGSTSAAQNVTLTNAGDATLNISSIGVLGPDFNETNQCGSSLSPGQSCTISVTFTPVTAGARVGTLNVADDAGGSPQKVNLTGTGTDFVLTASPRTATISRGQSAQFTITLTPTTGFTAAVSLSCSGAPPAGSCSLNPTSVTLNGTSASTATLNVSTTGSWTPGRPGNRQPPLSMPEPWIEALALLLGLACAVTAGRKQHWGARLRFGASLGALLVAALLWWACGGGGTFSSTPQGNYTVSVKAASGNLVHTVQVGVTVD
jgi:hypothetical protein